MYILPNLKYDFTALEPVIDAQTVEIHYTKHHQTYLDKLNAVLEGQKDLLDLPIEGLLKNISKIPENIRTVVRNNGGGYSNHIIYWDCMVPGGNREVSLELGANIKNEFGGLEELKSKIVGEGMGRFGSGWAWLIVDANRNLAVMSTPNQDSPYMEAITPILGVDVWEHAYYLKYQNRRQEYLETWWGLIDWKTVSDKYNRAVTR